MKRDIVLLHGWGLHAGVWDDTAQYLTAAGWRVTVLDLPGHGAQHAELLPDEMAAAAQQIAARAPTSAVWLGWSLGGMLALQHAAQHPATVQQLILVASSPRFVHAPDWPAAMADEVLQGFAQALENDTAATVTRFLGLQTLGSDAGPATARQLRALVHARPAASAQALHAGLALLRDTDLRAALTTLTLPVTALFGAHDRLVPPSAAQAIATLRPQTRVITLPGAGHAPFLSHPQPFHAALHEALTDAR